MYFIIFIGERVVKTRKAKEACNKTKSRLVEMLREPVKGFNLTAVSTTLIHFTSYLDGNKERFPELALNLLSVFERPLEISQSIIPELIKAVNSGNMVEIIQNSAYAIELSAFYVGMYYLLKGPTKIAYKIYRKFLHDPAFKQPTMYVNRERLNNLDD